MKKVLHATNKQEDPMRVFNHLSNHGERSGNGAVIGHLAPKQLKEGLQLLGSNLSDKEFNYLIEKVGTSHDGKISLLEFDEILHSEVVRTDNISSKLQKNNLKDNKRYSRTYQSCDTINFHNQAEYEKVTDSNIGRNDSMKWGKLQGIIQENCHKLPEAFKNAAKQFYEKRGRTLGQDSRNRRSQSVGSVRRVSKFGGEFIGGIEEEVTSSGRFYGREREERENINNMNNNIDNDSMKLPVNVLRDILSDAGVQLGTDDAMRLTNYVTREVGKNNSVKSQKDGNTNTNNIGNEPTVSLDMFCQIVGIPTVMNPSTSQKGKK